MLISEIFCVVKGNLRDPENCGTHKRWRTCEKASLCHHFSGAFNVSFRECNLERDNEKNPSQSYNPKMQLYFSGLKNRQQCMMRQQKRPEELNTNFKKKQVWNMTYLFMVSF